MKEYLERLLKYIDNPNHGSLKMSMNNVHAKGLFSLVLHGTEPGKLLRVFIATKKLKPFQVQYHTHRYPITISAIHGQILHHLAHIPVGLRGVVLDKFNYKSILNGGNGLTPDFNLRVRCEDHIIPIGGRVHLRPEDYHTVSCSKGSIWVVEEHGFQTDTSSVLGVPFTVDDLYTPVEMFQITDKVQLLRKYVKAMHLHYKLIE